MNEFVTEFFEKTKKGLDSVSAEEVNKAFSLLRAVYERDGRIYVFGNGGSLAIATHWVADFNKTVFSHHLHEKVKRFQAVRVPTTEEEITAWANDIGYDMVFAGPLANYLTETDLVIAISSSGTSPNIVKAVEFAKSMHVPVIGLSGFSGGPLKEMSDAKLHVDTEKGEYEVVESVHATIMHMMIKYLKGYFGYIFPPKNGS